MKKCKIEGCENKIKSDDLCCKHYQQIQKFGKIKRTKFDPNEIILYEDFAELILYDEDGNEKARALIDSEDVEKIKQYKWCYSNGYVGCHKLKDRLHRFILELKDDEVVDHINGNKLDNRKCNLRICSQQQNTFNTCINSNNTSGYKGVTWDKKRNKWIAQIMVNYKHIYLGRYENIEDAIKSRKDAELKYFGEYRRDDKNE